MSDYLPAEIWSSILRKSTPETLITCLSVCKSWNSLISSPSFIASHIAIQKPLLIASQSNNLHQVDLHTYLPLPLSTFDFLAKPDPHSLFRIIGTVNGVICLADDFLGMTETLVLWNPVIRRCVYPPNPIYSSSGMGYSSTLGFGSGSGTDLKIVRIARLNRGCLFGRRRQFPPQAEVFSVREQKWRSIDYDNANCFAYENRWAQCLLNGAVHWSAYLRSTRSVILSFDFEKEEFLIIELPLELQRSLITVSKVGNLLSVLQYKHTVGVSGSTGCDVWVMQEYGVASSWCKIASLDWEGGGLSNVMWVKEDGKEIIVSTETGDVLLYDASNHRSKSLGILCKGDGCFADGFVRSLGLLNEDDRK